MSWQTVSSKVQGTTEGNAPGRNLESTNEEHWRSFLSETSNKYDTLSHSFHSGHIRHIVLFSTVHL